MPAKRPSLAKEYSKGMSWHGYGHGLFHPVPTESMKPPCVGYFDDRGKWHLITNLAGQPEDPQWKDSDYTYLAEKPKRQPVAAETWGPKQTSDVYDKALGFSAGTPDLTAAGVPLQFSAETTWRTASDIGAILATAPKIIHEDFNDGYNRPYRKWMQENFDVLFAHGEDELQRYGLWVILETYSTAACVIQTWTGKTKEVKLALVANAMMAGELGPSIEWARKSNCEAVSAYASEDYGGRVVVFCNGIRFKFARRWQGLKRVPHPVEQLEEAVAKHARSSEPKSVKIKARNGNEFDMTYQSIEDGDVESSDSEEGMPITYISVPSQASESPPSKGEISIVCDGCDSRRLKSFYRCQRCPEFDLCVDCYTIRRRGCAVNIRHKFDKVRLVDGEVKTA